MRVPLLEGVEGAYPFKVDRTKPIVAEAAENGTRFYRLPGRFSVCNEVNGNNRRYANSVWEKNLAEGSHLQESIARNAAFGLLEHPDNGQVTLLSPISHLVTKAYMKENGEVHGELTILETAEGQKLKALIDAGYDPLVSSRGFGTLIRNESDGVDEVQDDFVCEGWDVVIKPSFASCSTTPERKESQQEDTKAKPAPEMALSENQDAPVSAAPAQEAAKPEQKTPITESITMNINDIKTGIASLQGVSAKGQTPTQFAESMSQAEALHQSIAEWQAEDPKRSYQAQKLHKQIDGVTESWEQAQQAPNKQVADLKEDKNKLLQVIKTLTENLQTARKALKEASEAGTKQDKLVEEVTKNGTSWKDRAEQLQGQLSEMTQKRDVACEALDIMADRYKEDMTITGRRVVQLEFAEAAATEDVKKRLEEATKPQDIIAIREELEGGKKPVTEGKDKDDDAKDDDCDDKDGDGKDDKSGEDCDESKKTDKVETKTGYAIESQNRNPRSVNESVGIANRLRERISG